VGDQQVEEIDITLSALGEPVLKHLIFLELQNMNYLSTTLSACLCAAALSCSKVNSEDNMKTNSPQPQIINKAQGGGRWFPANGNVLKKMVDDYIEKAAVPRIEGRIVSAIAPHAGYVYSGKVAGFTFRAIKDNAKGTNAPETVVILGFTHQMGFKGVALMDGDSVETPVGIAALDKAAAELMVKGRQRITLDSAPHMGEHSAENEVPFVQRTLPNAKLVVALIGDHDGKTLVDIVTALAELAKTKRILVVASSDMLHDPDYDLVTKTDRQTLKKVTALDDKGLASDWSGERQIFCGVMPVLAAMQFAKAQGCREGSVLYYRNNGDDDPSSRGNWVVGYGAAVFVVK